MSFGTETERFIIILPIIKSSVTLGHLGSERKAKICLSPNIFYAIMIMSYLVHNCRKSKKLTTVLSEARISSFFSLVQIFGNFITVNSKTETVEVPATKLPFPTGLEKLLVLVF